MATKKNDPLAKYQSTEFTAQHRVKQFLTNETINQYGGRIARILRHELPRLADENKANKEPLNEAIAASNVHIDGLLDQVNPMISDEEYEHGQELAQALADIDALQAEMRMLDLDYKSETQRLKNEAEQLEMRINLGYEMQSRQCRWYVDWKKGMKALIRDDNGEVVATQPLRAEERQLSLLDADPTFTSALAEATTDKTQADESADD